METNYSRTEMLIGKNAIEKLVHSTVAVFGVGGVGSYTVEALARAGVGKIVLIDNDKVSISNLNRQLIALNSTIGMSKVEVSKKRINDINPEIEVLTIEKFCLPDNIDEFFETSYDYVVDAIDTVSAKIAIVQKCAEKCISIISAMGTGNKLNPQDFLVSDIYDTEMCPLCRVMRKELKNRGIKSLKVVYSKEKPFKVMSVKNEENGKDIPGSIAFVPPVAGMIIAGEVIKDLTECS